MASVESFDLHRLDAGTGPRYAHLAFSQSRSVLGTLDETTRHVAIGAHVFGLPAGLVLAEVLPSGTLAGIISLLVAEPFKRRGIATSLVQAMQQLLAERGCRTVRAVYREQLQTRPIVECILRRCAWQQPVEVRLFVFRTPDSRDRWYFEPRTLAPGLRLSDWKDVSEEDLQELLERCDSDPRYKGARTNLDEGLEPLNSLVLRAGEEIVGWLHVLRLSPDTLHYSGIWVREDHRQGETALALIGEAIRRACEAGILWHWDAVPRSNRELIALLEFYLEDDLAETRDLVIATRYLRSDAG